MARSRKSSMNDDNSGSSSPRRGWRSSLLFIVYCLVLAEIFARAFVAIAGIELDESYGYPSDLFVGSSTRGYAYRPGFVGFFPNPGFSDIPISINSIGFRDRDFDLQSNAFRIMVLGDSITFGAGIRAESRFTDKLAESVCRKGQCQVMNLGVNGYQIENYEVVLREEASRLSPDLVIIAFCMNDIQRMSTSAQIEQVRRSSVISRIRQAASYSTALRLIAKGIRSLTWDAEEYRTRWIRRATKAWSSEENRRRLVETLKRMKKLAMQQDAEIVAILFPERSQLEDFPEWGKSYQWAEQAFEAAAIPYVSGRKALGAERPAIPKDELDEIYLPGDNIHFTPLAHERLARALQPAVIERMNR